MQHYSIRSLSLLALCLLPLSCAPDFGAQSVSGTIETDEARLASRYGGRVERVLAREGDELKAGQVVVELNAAELQARRDELSAQLAELQAGPRPQEIEAARADWEALVAQRDLARLEAERSQRLFADNTISVTDRDRAVAQADALDKNAAAAKSRYDLLKAGTRPERIAQVQAQLAELGTQLAEMRIAAQTNCVLEVLSVKPGDVLAPNQPAATVLLPGHLWVRVYVPEPWLGRIRIGQTVTVRVDGFPGRDFHGAVEQVNRQAEFTPRNVQTVGERVRQVFGVKILLDNSSGDLRAGMSADAFFQEASK